MSVDADSMLDELLSKWSPSGVSDSRLDYLVDKYSEWIQQISPNAQDWVFILLKNLEYYSHESVNENLCILHQKLINSYSVSLDDTVFLFIAAKSGQSNSSNDCWTEYKRLNHINKESCIAAIENLNEPALEFINNFVFIDDCCGSGKTITDYIEKHKDVFAGKNIYYLVIHIMEEALDKIKRNSENLGINITPVFCHMQKIAFCVDSLGDCYHEAKNIIETLSNDFGIPKREILGFKESQSLLAFYSNTPNNTLGIMRYDTEHYFSPFPRENNPLPGWKELARDKQKRKTFNYNSKVR